MNSGRVRQIGTPGEVYHEPADTFVATFVGSPPMNLVEKGDVLVGFRPESFLPLGVSRGHEDLEQLEVEVNLVAALGLTESIGALILVYPTFTIPFCTWLLMGFFKSIPKDIEEQALIDGYSRFGGMVRVVLPLSVSGILTVVVFAFTLSMQEFIYALAFISVSAQKTVSIGVPTELVRGDVFRWGPLMAAALIASIPVAVLYSLFLDRFIAGFTAGAVK